MAKTFIEWAKRFLHFLQHDLWRIDLVHDSKLRVFGVESLRVIHLVLKGVKEDNCKLHASALTYSTLMAMIPFLVILFSISSAIGFTTASEKMIEWSADMPQVQKFVYTLIEMVEKTDMAALGMFGGVIFLYIIFKLMSGIEESFNQIWGVQSPRSVADKIRNYLSVLVVTPILMIGANFLSIKFAAFSSQIPWLGPFIELLLQIAPILIMTVAFVAVFLFIPNTQVKFRAALVGGFASAFLAIILQALMVKLGVGVTRLSKIYGTFAYIPIFLFWLQMSWTILLFGAELAFAIQNRGTYAEEQAAVRASMLAKLWVAYSVMQETVRVFHSSEAAMQAVVYARENNIPIRLMNEVIRVLARATLLGPVTTEGPHAYVLLQAPEQVTAKKIYDLLISDGSSPKELGLAEDFVADEVLSAANLGLDETLDSITLGRFSESTKE
ncbi:MAG: YihY/virulence factor BrkB family protein [Kiritimatiellaceae bacterium]|nr:YihY/virulence factor BrkB family protein [Kiritimatiellaceae bacterium]